MEAIVVVQFQRCAVSNRFASQVAPPRFALFRVLTGGTEPGDSRKSLSTISPMARSFRTACLLAAPLTAALGVLPATAQFVNPFEALFGAAASALAVSPAGGHRRLSRRRQQQGLSAGPAVSAAALSGAGAAGAARRRRAEPALPPPDGTTAAAARAARRTDGAAWYGRPASVSRAARRSLPTPRRNPAMRSFPSRRRRRSPTRGGVLRARQDHRPHHHLRCRDRRDGAVRRAAGDAARLLHPPADRDRRTPMRSSRSTRSRCRARSSASSRDGCSRPALACTRSSIRSMTSGSRTAKIRWSRPPRRRPRRLRRP